jgi:hypothetical protein
VKGGGAVTRREAALVRVAERYGDEDVERAEVEGVRGFCGSGSSSRAAPASRRRRCSWLLLLLFFPLSSGCG